MFPHFQKYLNAQVKTNKLVNSGCLPPFLPSRLASGIHLYFFKLLRVLSLSRMLVGFSNANTIKRKKFFHTWRKYFYFSFYGVYIRNYVEYMHFYSCPSFPHKTPGTIFWKSDFQCLYLMHAEVAWVLVSSGTQVQLQIIPNPDYLPDYLSVSYDYVQI